jgi:ribosomal protein L11 methyltransferase
MMYHYIFQIKEEKALDKTQKELIKKGLKDPYIIEDDATGAIFIGGQSKKNIETDHAILIEKQSAEIDWEKQWEQFAENYKDGHAHINLLPFGQDKILKLLPGPGFGDLSHPTTQLMMELMKSYVPNQNIVDIGCGSGILTLAALYLNAKSAVGIDIDQDAIKHSKQNAKLNDLPAKFTKSIPKKFPKSCICLMNMIFPEQKMIDIHKFQAKLWITSGILKEQKNSYLEFAEKWNWQLIRLKEKDGWLGFVFEQK